MKRYDQVYFLHDSINARTIIKKGLVASLTPGAVIITPKGSNKVEIVPKDRVSKDKGEMERLLLTLNIDQVGL